MRGKKTPPEGCREHTNILHKQEDHHHHPSCSPEQESLPRYLTQSREWEEEKHWETAARS